MADIVDLNIYPTIETVDVTIQTIIDNVAVTIQPTNNPVNLTITPNLITINVNQVTGGGAVSSVNTLVGDVVLTQDTVLDGSTFKQYSLTEKNKLAGIAAGAEVNVNADWNATSGDAQILNKPSIPAAQVNSDWNASSGVAQILNKPTIPSGTVTSVGLTMPTAFNVANSPITSSGTLAVTGAGLVSQYVRGDGSLANFPSSTGGGASLSFYLNGSVSQGTFGGIAFKEMDRTPILGAGTDFTINANGYIQSFITDVNVPNLLEIPAGNWNFETYFSASSGGGSPTFYVELYKWNGTTLSLIASNSSSPESITNGTAIDLYISALAIPQTTLLATDRLAVRIYVNHSGRTITLHTEDNHLCEIITTFSTGITALNGLTTQVQNLTVGTSGTDFAISSISATHTFNLPTASATNRGALSSTDWTTFNNKQNDLGFTAENVANKENTTLDTSTTKYPTNRLIKEYTDAKVADTITDGVTTIAPSQNAVFDALALKENALGFTAENVTNKQTDLTASATKYPTVNAVNTGLALKQNALSYTPYKNIQTSQTAITGTVLETVAFTATIAAGTFNSTDVIKVLFGANKTTALGIFSLRIRLNTTNTIVGSTIIGTYIGTTSAQVNLLMRNFNLNGGNLYGHPFTSGSLTDIVAIAGTLGSTTLNTSNLFYLFATLSLNSSSDSIIGNMFSIHN
jgi:hypothetical protein